MVLSTNSGKLRKSLPHPHTNGFMNPPERLHSTANLRRFGYSVESGGAKEIVNGGCDGFIQKPFTMKEPFRSIREILKREWLFLPFQAINR
jgi:hypothetical protein